MPDKPANDPIARLMEWQDHRYDPGYFLGGRIHPILLAPRPKKFGYLLIIFGSSYLLLPCFLVSADPLRLLDLEFGCGIAALMLLLMLTGYGTVQLAAGFKLLQKPRAQASSPEYEDEFPEEPWWKGTEPKALPLAQPDRPATGHKSRKPHTRKTIRRR